MSRPVRYAAQVSETGLELTTGRPTADRSDSRRTRQRIVDGIGSYAVTHGWPPARLADVAAHVGVSTATVYRYFGSLDDLVSAHLARLPEHAVELFRRRRPGADPLRALHAWNRCWVEASLRFGSMAAPLRSPRGFLARRAEGDPLVVYVCDQVTPLLDACGLPVDAALAVWNVVSDPREVVDLRETLGWSPERIARHVTHLTLATAS